MTMKNLITKYFLFATGFLLVVSATFTLTLNHDPENYGLTEFLGYATIILSMGFIVLGILEYRKRHGSTSFGKSFQIGIMITLLVSLVFTAYSYVYYAYIDPGFTERYYAQYVEQIKSGDMPDWEKETKIAELEEFAGMSNGVQALIMFATAFVIGLIITILASLLVPRFGKNRARAS